MVREFGTFGECPYQISSVPDLKTHDNMKFYVNNKNRSLTNYPSEKLKFVYRTRTRRACPVPTDSVLCTVYMYTHPENLSSMNIEKNNLMSLKKVCGKLISINNLFKCL